MPQQLLDGAEIGAALEQVRRERMAERVRRGPIGKPARLHPSIDHQPRPARREWSAAGVEEERTASGSSTGEGLATSPEVDGQRLGRRTAEDHLALLVALAQHAQALQSDVEAAQLGAGGLRDADPRRVQQLEEG